MPGALVLLAGAYACAGAIEIQCESGLGVSALGEGLRRASLTDTAGKRPLISRQEEACKR